MKKRLSNLMQLMSLTIVLALVAPVMIHAQADKADFAGTWAMNTEKSTMPQGGGESKSTANWSGDGKTLTIVTKSNFNGNERTSTAIWSLIDAKTLSIVSTRQGQDGEVKATIVYDKK